MSGPSDSAPVRQEETAQQAHAVEINVHAFNRAARRFYAAAGYAPSTFWLRRELGS